MVLPFEAVSMMAPIPSTQSIAHPTASGDIGILWVDIVVIGHWSWNDSSDTAADTRRTRSVHFKRQTLGLSRSCLSLSLLYDENSWRGIKIKMGVQILKFYHKIYGWKSESLGICEVFKMAAQDFTKKWKSWVGFFEIEWPTFFR